MQDAQLVGWMPDPQGVPGVLESVRELNHRFLDLVSNRTGEWATPGRGAPARVSAQVAPLSSAQKAAAAGCPYALFDLRFHDDGHWRARLGAVGPWGVAEEEDVDPSTLDFVRVALFFAWHVAATARVAAQLLLGMHEATVVAFRNATIDRLPALAVAEAKHLTARWNDCGAYWSSLTAAAARPDVVSLRRIQLYGVQLAAAVRME